MSDRERAVKRSLDIMANISLSAAALLFCAWLAPEVIQRWNMPSQQSQRTPRLTQDVEGSIAKAQLTNMRGSGRIAIVEFSDFECPFCARHVLETLPALKHELIDSGQVRYAVVNFPLPMHPYAIPAAEAAECAADQGKYWEMHALLFQKQKELQGADFATYAKLLGLDHDAFDVCVKSRVKHAKIKADLEEAMRLGVNSTPTFFVGRIRPDGGVDLLKRVNGAQSMAVLKEEVERLKG